MTRKEIGEYIDMACKDISEKTGAGITIVCKNPDGTCFLAGQYERFPGELAAFLRMIEL